jgi:hypothetical protein
MQNKRHAKIWGFTVLVNWTGEDSFLQPRICVALKSFFCIYLLDMKFGIKMLHIVHSNLRASAMPGLTQDLLQGLGTATAILYKFGLNLAASGKAVGLGKKGALP